MDSSFLTWVNVGLAIYSVISFFKLLIQFGISSHPLRLTAYLVVMCVSAYFAGLALTDLGFVSPMHWMQWRAIPLVAGSLALLLQVILMGTKFSRIQQKVISRMPIIAAMLCFAFFPGQATAFMILTLVAGSIFLSISVGNVRYQKRQYFKLVFFLSLSYGFKLINHYWAYVLGEILIFAALFYFFIFEQSFAITAQMDDFKSSLEGDT